MPNTPAPDEDMLKKNPLSLFDVFDRGKLHIVLITVALILAVVWFGIVLKNKVLIIEKQWNEFNDEATQASYVLSRVHINFGYGGFIHNFKNYVLRKDEMLIPKIEKSLLETLQAVEDYPINSKVYDADDKIYINNLIQVIKQYQVNFELAKQLVAKGESSNQIDRRVKVNDASALEAIEHLSKHTIEINKIYEFETNKRLNDTLKYIDWGFIILVPLIFFSGVFMLILLHRSKLFNHDLEENRKFLSDLFEAAPDGMMIVDKKGIISEANQQAEKLFCATGKDLIGKSVESLIPQRFREQHKTKRVNSFVATERRALMSEVELYALDKDNNEIPVDISLSFTKRNDEKYAIVIIRDITVQKNAEERIQYLAQFDQLTKLPNRTLFDDRLHHSIERAKRNKQKVSLMFLDIDGFKNINDSFGHQAGDELLMIIADRISRVLRNEDTVARFGGDEFAIILERLEHSDYAAVLAKKVLQVVGEVIYLSGHEVRVGISVGISIYPDNGIDANTLLKNADIAMYQAKNQGKNCYKFYINNKTR